MINQKSTRYMFSLIIFLSYTLFAISWKVGDIVITQLGFQTNDLANLTIMLNMTKVTMSFLAAFFVAKVLTSKVFKINLSLLAVGLLFLSISMSFMSYSDSIYWLFLMRGLTGIGGAFILYTMNPLVDQIFPKEELPLVNGINASAFNIGMATTLTLYSIIAVYPQSTTTILSALMLVLFVLLGFYSLKAIKQTGNSKTKENKEEISTQSEKWGLKEGLFSRFNWAFSLTFTGVMSFYYVLFTFLEPSAVSYVLYAGVFGNIAGVMASKKLDQHFIIRLASFVQFLTAVGFLFTTDPLIKAAFSIALGFSIFFSFPSFITLGFKQKNVTTKKVAITFTFFWIISDLFASAILKVFAYLQSSSGNGYSAAIFILAVDLVFFIGCVILTKSDDSLEDGIVLN